MKVEIRDVYICDSCGREFTTESGCRIHEAEEAIGKFADELSLGSGGVWNSGMIRDALLCDENAEKWIALLTALVEARR